MIFEGDTGVIDAIKEKKRLMDAGEEHGHVRPMLIVDGGLMKGVYGVGAAIAMDDLGVFDCFHTMVGVSSGAPTVAYTLADSSHVGASIMWDELCTKNFLSMWRWKNPLNSLFFRRVMEGETDKPLFSERVLRSIPEFFIGLSKYTTAEPVLLKPENEEELFSSIRASISMPGAVSDKIMVRGERYVDGASTEPHVIQHAYESLDATHVLVITNQDKGTGDILWWDKFLTKTVFRFRMSKSLRDVALRRRKIRHDWVSQILQNPVKPICFSWGNGSIKSFERDREVVQRTIEHSCRWWKTQLE